MPANNTVSVYDVEYDESNEEITKVLDLFSFFNGPIKYSQCPGYLHYGLISNNKNINHFQNKI